MWAPRSSANTRAGDELIHNPVVGDLDLTFDAMEPPASGKRLLLTIYTATPGSASHDSLQMRVDDQGRGVYRGSSSFPTSGVGASCAPRSARPYP